MNNRLKEALLNELWVNHKLDNRYKMDNETGYKISYYPIFENGKTNEIYKEARALVEKDLFDSYGKKIGTDFREVPLHYLILIN